MSLLELERNASSIGCFFNYPSFDHENYRHKFLNFWSALRLTLLIEKRWKPYHFDHIYEEIETSIFEEIEYARCKTSIIEELFSCALELDFSHYYMLGEKWKGMRQEYYEALCDTYYRLEKLYNRRDCFADGSVGPRQLL